MPLVNQNKFNLCEFLKIALILKGEERRGKEESQMYFSFPVHVAQSQFFMWEALSEN